MKPFALAVLAASPVVFSGCFSSVPPEMELAGARLADTTPEARIVNFKIDAINPGPDPITIYDVEYAVRVEGREVFRGVRAGEAVLGRYAQRSLELPAAIPVDAFAAGSAGGPAELSATFTYVPASAFREVLFDAGWRPTTALRGERTVTLP